MDAQELFVRITNYDGKHQFEPHRNLAVCGKCGMIAYNGLEQAEKCCRKFVCPTHGEQESKFSCAKCWRLNCDAKNAKGLAEAEFVDGYDDWVYYEMSVAEQVGADGACHDGTNFWESPRAFSDWWSENMHPGIPKPPFVFCCTSKAFSLDLHDIIENEAEQDDYGEEIEERVCGENELSAAIDAFNEANKRTLSYQCDTAHKAVVPA